MRFTLFTKTNLYDKVIIDTLKDVLGNNLSVVEDETFIVVYHSFSETKVINSVFSSIASELFVKIIAYTSYDLDDKKLSKELNIASFLLLSLPMGYYSFKEALLATTSIENKSYLLDFVLDGTGVTTDIIKVMAEADLNVSKASKISYLHRNTLIYKLDKLKAEKNFDLRVFLDEYILFSLIDRNS